MKNIIRWTARIISLLIILFFILSVIGEKSGNPLTTSDTIRLSLWVMVMIGFLIAWKWELFGACLIIVISLIHIFFSPELLHSLAFWLSPLTGLLFYTSWKLNRKKVN